VVNVFHKWASLGAYIPGDINPLEDPEKVLMESLDEIPRSARLMGIVATWLSHYGHLLLTKKLKFRNKSQRRLFSALVEISGTTEGKLKRMIQKGPVRKKEYLHFDAVEVLKERAKADSHPVFLRHGWILKNGPILREKVILPASGVFERSRILRYRALYGPSLRSDFLAVFPEMGKTSVRQIAQRLGVAAPSLEPVVRDFEASGLVQWKRNRRWSCVEWTGSEVMKAA